MSEEARTTRERGIRGSRKLLSVLKYYRARARAHAARYP